MKHRNSHLFVGYWSRLRSGREVPDQADIDPRALKRMLSHVFILDARDCARPSYRLAGTALCERFGRELRDTSFFAHWESEAREPLVRVLARSLRTSQPVWLSAIGTTEKCAVAEVETVLAPLASGPGLPQRFLGIAHFMGDLTQLAGRPILSERLIDSGMAAERETADPIDPPAPRPPFRTHFPARGAPHLRLVVSHEPSRLHCDLDEGMKKLVGALDVLRQVGTAF
jgi:hypothetical protein